MIVLSGALVLVALVLLVFGALDRNLPYVYASIGVSVLSLLLLVVGILQRRGELDGDDQEGATPVTDTSAAQEAALVGAAQEVHPAQPEEPAAAVVRPAPAAAAQEAPAVQHGSRRVEPEAADDVTGGEQPLADSGDDQLEDQQLEDQQLEDQEPQDEEPEDQEPQDEEPEDQEPEDEELEDEELEDEGSPVTVLVVSGRPRYHLEGCRVLRGKEPQSLARDDARTHGFSPCGVCKPDADETAAGQPAPQSGQQGSSVTEALFGGALVAGGSSDDAGPARTSAPAQPVLADAEPARVGGAAESAPAADAEPVADDEVADDELGADDEVADVDALGADDEVADVDELGADDEVADDELAADDEVAAVDELAADDEVADDDVADDELAADHEAVDVDETEAGGLGEGPQESALSADRDDADLAAESSAASSDQSELPERSEVFEAPEPPVELQGDDPADDPALDADDTASAPMPREDAADPDDRAEPRIAEPVESQLVESQPVESEPLESEPVESQPLGSDGAEVLEPDAPSDEPEADHGRLEDAPVGASSEVEPAAVAAGARSAERATSTSTGRRKAPARVPTEPAPTSRGGAKQAPAKAPVKKAPAKKAPAKRAPAKKASAEKAPAPAAAAPATPAVKRPVVRAVRADALRLGAPSTGVTTTRVAARAAAPPAASPVVVVPDRDRFHRPQCRFVRDVAGATTLPKPSATRQGYAACGVCKP